MPGGLGIDEGQVGVQDAAPAVGDVVDAAGVEEGVPLLGDEGGAAGVGAGGEDRQHVDALDKLDVGAEVGDVVDLVLEQDPRHLVADEVGRLVHVVGLEQEVVAQRPLEHGQHQVAAPFHGRVARDMAPQLDRVRQQCVFRRAFLVFSVGAVEKAFGPRVPVIPVKRAGEWKVRVVGGWIGAVPYQSVHPLFMGGDPAVVEIANDSGGVYEVRPVETVLGSYGQAGFGLAVEI